MDNALYFKEALYIIIDSITTTAIQKRLGQPNPTAIRAHQRSKISMLNKLTTDASRRHFIKVSAIGFAIAPVAQLLMSATVQAGRAKQDGPVQAPALSEDDPQAKALHYREEAAEANVFGRKEGQFCHNCQLYSGQPGAEWGPCAIFSYRTHPKTNAPYEVSAAGWCQGWGPRASAQ